MGNTTSLINKTTCEGLIDAKVHLQQQIKLSSTHRHAYFGQVQVWLLPHREQKMFSKIQYGSTQDDKDAMVAAHDSKCALVHPTLLKYYGCSFYERYEITTNMMECHSFYEYPTMDLRSVVEHHKQHLNMVREPKLLEVYTQKY